MSPTTYVPRLRLGVLLAAGLVLSACAAQEETNMRIDDAMSTARAADQDAEAALAMSREARDTARAADRKAETALEEARRARAEVRELSERMTRMFSEMQRK